MSFFKLRFGGKIVLLGFEWAPSATQNALQSQKGHLPVKMDVLNDTKATELAKSWKETGNICDPLWLSCVDPLWIKSKFPNAKIAQNKACGIYGFHLFSKFLVPRLGFCA